MMTGRTRLVQNIAQSVAKLVRGRGSGGEWGLVGGGDDLGGGGEGLPMSGV